MGNNVYRVRLKDPMLRSEYIEIEATNSMTAKYKAEAIYGKGSLMGMPSFERSISDETEYEFVRNNSTPGGFISGIVYIIQCIFSLVVGLFLLVAIFGQH